MADIRKVPAPADGQRVETGAIQFGDDWPGVFIRGDNAGALAMQLADQNTGFWREMAVRQTAKILAGAVIGPAAGVLREAVERRLKPGEQPGEFNMQHMRAAAVRAHALLYALMLKHPEIPELQDDGELHNAVHDILRVDGGYYTPAPNQTDPP